MNIATTQTVPETRASLGSARTSRKTIGLVPTMGALHAAHAALIKQASNENDFVVVSIFVNPLQFGPSEDYLRYPRPLDKDLEICERMGAALAFVPRVEDLYAAPQQAFVEVGRLAEHLCGAFRPGHFRGVATVVAKLFNIVQPDRAYFGEKDYQQLQIIRRMVQDLNFPLEIVPVPTIRDADGLALSSRNAYLAAPERAAAPVLQRALQSVRRVIEDERCADASVAKSYGLRVLEAEPLVRVEYLEIVDADMQPVQQIKGEVRIAAAIYVGKTRLIDNVGASL